MDFKDIPRVYIGDNVFIPYWEGNNTDSGCNPYEYTRAFDLEAVKLWVEENSKNWYGGIRMKWVPLTLPTEGVKYPREIYFSYNGTRNIWTDLYGNPANFNNVIQA